MKTYYSLIFIICLLPLHSVYANQWPASVDFNADAGSGSGHAISNQNGEEIVRCDAERGDWPLDGTERVAPPLCHRYGLVWAAHSKDPLLFDPSKDTLSDYNPSVVGNDWRLPTIKELVRIFSYGTYTDENGDIKNLGMQDPVFSAWLDDVGDGYLISSTYRNISGKVDDNEYEFNQIFVIKISNGQVLAAEPGNKISGSGLQLCLGMIGNMTGACDYPSDEVTEFSKVNFYALKVRTKTTTELGYE